MRTYNYASFSDVANFLTKNCICVEYKDINKEPFENEIEKFEENMSDLEEIEVFSDHLLMGKRLRKSLYAGNLEEPPDHPPIALTGLALELFSKAVPNDGIDILNMDYVSYTTKAAGISPCAMIVAMIYLERLKLKNADYLEVVSPTGLFVATMLVASKFLFENEDDIVTNQMWAEALQFDVKELNELEREFLSSIDWKVLVNSTDYFNYLCKIEKLIAIKQSSLRDWLSYSDICVLLEGSAVEIFWTSCLKTIVKTMVIWTVGYVATTVALHNAGIGLAQMKSEVKDVGEINSTAELSTEIQSVIQPSTSNLSHCENGDFSLCSLSPEVLTECEIKDDKVNMRPMDQDTCALFASVTSTLNNNFITDKLKDTFQVNKSPPLSDFYHTNVVHFRSNITCFSLLM